ncbi:type 1 glutamine amidotransferase family protein [Microlunatus spumicola]|uniref:Type 1 glutamine amidotransferase family protein n=1 Tax=Microlunatus spumicola TaxID=81499 RepID=A0ABP6WFL3_9ACTN
MADVVLYATDTMADWEYGYLTAGLAWVEGGPYRLRVLGEGPGPVTTKGRLRLMTDGGLDEVDEDATALLVLPGADTWAAGHDVALALARRLLARGVPVAAICGATYGLARVGLLDERDHTSNAPDFLLPTGYAGADRYRDAPVVEDRDLITAGATKPVDFAAAVFRRLDVFPPAVVDAWHGLYTTGKRRYFDDLMATGAA